jgi:hypothetical protein
VTRCARAAWPLPSDAVQACLTRPMQPPPSPLLLEFAQRLGCGRPIVANEYVWRTYLEPGFTHAHRQWNSLVGTANQAGFRFDFELALVENRSLPNAICGHHGTKHCILIYHTFPMFVLEYFSRLLNSRWILPDVGKLSDEASNRTAMFRSPPGFGIISGEVRVQHLDDIIDVCGPQCSERRLVALKLFHYAMQFLIEHEMAHAVNGHVHYAREHLGFREINESVFRASSHEQRLGREYAFLEGGADKGSYFSVIGGPLLKRMHTPYQVMSSGDVHLVTEVRLQILAGALLAVFWMICDVWTNTGLDMKAYEKWNDHPSSLARALGVTLMPLVQAEQLPPEVQYFIRKGTELAAKDLIELSNRWALFRPFRWLVRDDLYATIFQPHDLSPAEAQEVIQKLERFRYRRDGSGSLSATLS